MLHGTDTLTLSGNTAKLEVGYYLDRFPSTSGRPFVPSAPRAFSRCESPRPPSADFRGSRIKKSLDLPHKARGKRATLELGYTKDGQLSIFGPFQEGTLAASIAANAKVRRTFSPTAAQSRDTKAKQLLSVRSLIEARKKTLVKWRPVNWHLASSSPKDGPAKGIDVLLQHRSSSPSASTGSISPTTVPNVTLKNCTHVQSWFAKTI